MEINYLAAFVGALINIAIALVWYNPKVFGTIWMKAAGTENMDMAQEKKAMPKKMFLVLISSFIMAYVLALLVGVFNATTFAEGVMVAFWVWLGFSMTNEFGRTLWENAPLSLLVVNGAYMIVSYALIGGMLAVWR